MSEAETVLRGVKEIERRIAIGQELVCSKKSGYGIEAKDSEWPVGIFAIGFMELILHMAGDPPKADPEPKAVPANPVSRWKLNDAACVCFGYEWYVARVIAITEDGRAIAKLRYSTVIESRIGEWQKVRGVFESRGWLSKRWVFVPGD